VKWYITLGTLCFVIFMAVLAVVGINESQRMQTYTAAFASRNIEEGAAIFDANCRTCHGPQGKGVEGLAPAINTAAMFNGQRLEEVGFAGTVEDYLEGTISAGRPVPSEGTNYPQRMPTWSQEYGGPLRPDQIKNVVAFIMNWQSRALAEAEAPTPVPSEPVVGTDITVPLPEGDPQEGERLASSLGCVACHVLADVGPAWLPSEELPGIGERALTRFEEPDYTGAATTAEQYLLESIVQPNAFMVAGYETGVMPPSFADQLTKQEAADLIAYMLTLR
jgi:mono/diheme cytochrome c family protein